MTRFVLLLLSLVLCADQLLEPLSDDEVKEGFIVLINGKDFSGWRFSGTIPNKDKTVKPKPFTSTIDVIPDNWKAGDGMIQLLKGGNPNLASQWDFDDFEVRLQWRAHKKSYNSGFYVRSGKSVGANQINLNQPAVGELINTVPALKDKGKGVPELHKEGGNGEWNDWRVLVVGKKITFWVNSKPAWEVEEFVPARGYLGFQAEGTIDFRNLRIKEIGYEVFREPTTSRAKAGRCRMTFFPAAASYPHQSRTRITLSASNFAAKDLWSWASTKLALDQADFKPLLHPADQFNYLQVKATDGKAKVWLNTLDLKNEMKVGEGASRLFPRRDWRSVISAFGPNRETVRSCHAHHAEPCQPAALPPRSSPPSRRSTVAFPTPSRRTNGRRSMSTPRPRARIIPSSCGFMAAAGERATRRTSRRSRRRSWTRASSSSPPTTASFPNVTVKEMTGDIAKAIRWVHDHAKEYGGDPKSIFVMGHSPAHTWRPWFAPTTAISRPRACRCRSSRAACRWTPRSTTCRSRSRQSGSQGGACTGRVRQGRSRSEGILADHPRRQGQEHSAVPDPARRRPPDSRPNRRVCRQAEGRWRVGESGRRRGEEPRDDQCRPGPAGRQADSGVVRVPE